MTHPASRKPLIGLTGRRSTGAVLGPLRGFLDAPVDLYLSEYATSVRDAGGAPVHISLDSDAADIVPHLDALLLSGGDDIDPRRYGAVPGPHTVWIDPHRDEHEVAFLAAAIERGIPVLGICRGQQLINVARGGTLVQHLPVGEGESHASTAYHRATRTHLVETEPGSVVERVYGASARVNSFHHQAVADLGTGLRATAHAADGVIEAIELDGAPVVAVQWHPETFGGDPIFDWLVESAITRTAIREKQ